MPAEADRLGRAGLLENVRVELTREMGSVRTGWLLQEYLVI